MILETVLATFLGLWLLAAIIWPRVLRPKTSWKNFEGEWALVTGASMGIGHEIARGLASRGVNVIVSARTESKLKQVVQELKEKYHVEAEYIAADLARDLDDKLTLQRFEALFEKRTISILVNNLGGPLIDMMNFVDVPHEQLKFINNMNSGSTFVLTQMALKRMLPRHKGRIINCGSMSSYGSPWLLPYGAEKKKLEAFAESLQMELEGTGVQVQTALIAATFSEAIAAYNGISKPSWSVPSAFDVSNSILDLFGFGGSCYAHNFSHWTQALPVGLMPGFLRRMILRQVYTKLKEGNKQKTPANGAKKTN